MHGRSLSWLGTGTSMKSGEVISYYNHYSSRHTVSKSSHLNLKNKMKNKKYHTAGTVSKSNRKIIERGKIGTPNTQIHDH